MMVNNNNNNNRAIENVSLIYILSLFVDIEIS